MQQTSLQFPKISNPLLMIAEPAESKPCQMFALKPVLRQIELNVLLILKHFVY